MAFLQPAFWKFDIFLFYFLYVKISWGRKKTGMLMIRSQRYLDFLSVKFLSDFRCWITSGDVGLTCGGVRQTTSDSKSPTSSLASRARPFSVFPPMFSGSSRRSGPPCFNSTTGAPPELSAAQNNEKTCPADKTN